MAFFKNKNETVVYLILTTLFVTTCFILFFVFKPYLWAMFLSLLFYITTRKLHKKLKSILGVRAHSLSPYIMVILMLAGVIVPSYLIVSTLIRESLNLVNYIRNQLTEESIVALLLNSPMLTDFFTEMNFFGSNSQAYIGNMLANIWTFEFGFNLQLTKKLIGVFTRFDRTSWYDILQWFFYIHFTLFSL